MTVAADFPKALREWRTSKRLSQTKLAALLSVSRGTICNYEHGKTKMPYETAQALLSLGFSPEQIEIGGYRKRATIREELTDEERTFAEKHHKLVFSLLRDKALQYDDWYDVVIFGYLLAVQKMVCASRTA